VCLCVCVCVPLCVCVCVSVCLSLSLSLSFSLSLSLSVCKKKKGTSKGLSVLDMIKHLGTHPPKAPGRGDESEFVDVFNTVNLFFCVWLRLYYGLGSCFFVLFRI